MAYDIFLSYARQDTDKARQIKDLLEGLGLNVFFDTEGLDGGDVFPDILDRELKTAGAVVGVWSKHALTRPWVKIECDIGKTRGVLVPLQIEQISDLDRPAAFWNIQFADLSDFDGDPDHVGWLRFIRALARTLNREDLLERESAAQAAEPASDDAAVRAELAALRAEMSDMRNAKAALAAQVNQPPVAEVTATGLGVWQEIKDSDNPAAIRRFLETVRGTPLEHVVEAKLDALENGPALGSDNESFTQLVEDLQPGRYDGPSREPAPPKASKAPWIIAASVAVTVSLAGLLYALGVVTLPFGSTSEPEPVAANTTQPPPSPAQSVAYHEQACADGVATACMSAATAYAYGEDGAEKDQFVAMTYYDMGCNLGDMEACWVAGISAEQGEDFVTARTYYDKACRGGAEDGCELQEALAKMQAVQAADQARTDAIIRLQQALIDQDFMTGPADGVAGPATRQALGSFYLVSGTTQSQTRFNTAPAEELNRIAAQVEGWQRPAAPAAPATPDWAKDLTMTIHKTYADMCLAGDYGGCVKLAEAYANGQTGQQDMQTALQLARKACDAEFTDGCRLAAWYEQFTPQ